MSIERKRLDAAGADTVRRASTRRFAALLLAQACLLLGSVVLCFAYPLYVLDETGSATAYGLVGGSVLSSLSCGNAFGRCACGPR